MLPFERMVNGRLALHAHPLWRQLLHVTHVTIIESPVLTATLAERSLFYNKMETRFPFGAPLREVDSKIPSIAKLLVNKRRILLTATPPHQQQTEQLPPRPTPPHALRERPSVHPMASHSRGAARAL